jgi:hypothetical protein
MKLGTDMNTTTNNMPVVRSLERVNVWELNPRGESYRDLEELKASLEREGLQDAIHVWVRLDGDYLIAGTDALRRCGSWAGRSASRWSIALRTSARRIRYLRSSTTGTRLALNNNEKIVNLVTNGMSLGLNGEDIAASIWV